MMRFGVNVDNIPIRGSSGTFFSQIDSNSISLTAKTLNVRLVMLEFGGNMMLLILTLKRLDRKNKFANSLDYSLFLVENNV